MLIIGGGSSAIDLVEHLSKSVIRLTWSQHKHADERPEEYEHRKSLLPSNAILQEDVKRFTKTGAEFMDGTHETFSVVFYATGSVWHSFYYFYYLLRIEFIYCKISVFDFRLSL